ncbi:MAG: response regulator [bacterium]
MSAKPNEDAVVRLLRKVALFAAVQRAGLNPRGEPQKGEGEESAEGSINILVVDDEESFRETVRDLLEGEGYAVDMASGGAEAVEMAGKKLYDVAFIDIVMPEMNGVETLKALKRVSPETEVVMMTGYSVRHLVREAMASGAYKSVSKPFDLKEALSIIDEIAYKKYGEIKRRKRAMEFDRKEMMEKAGELMRTFTDTVVGLCLLHGVKLGLISWMPLDRPFTPEEAADHFNYDRSLIERWFRFAHFYGLIEKAEGGYRPTTLAALLRADSPLPELSSFVNALEFFAWGIGQLDIKKFYQPQRERKKLAADKEVSQSYVPRVISPVAKIVANMLTKYGVAENDTVLDLACGDGTFMRELVKLVKVKCVGIEVNPFIIQIAEDKNKQEKVGDMIKIEQGDILKEMDSIKDRSFDWVSGLNMIYFFDKSDQDKIAKEMHRIARKGIVLSTGVLNNLSTYASNALSCMYMDDFKGLPTEEDMSAFLNKNFKNYIIEDIAQGKLKLIFERLG